MHPEAGGPERSRGRSRSVRRDQSARSRASRPQGCTVQHPYPSADRERLCIARKGTGCSSGVPAVAWAPHPGRRLRTIGQRPAVEAAWPACALRRERLPDAQSRRPLLRVKPRRSHANRRGPGVTRTGTSSTPHRRARAPHRSTSKSPLAGRGCADETPSRMNQMLRTHHE